MEYQFWIGVELMFCFWMWCMLCVLWCSLRINLRMVCGMFVCVVYVWMCASWILLGCPHYLLKFTWYICQCLQVLFNLIDIWVIQFVYQVTTNINQILTKSVRNPLLHTYSCTYMHIYIQTYLHTYIQT